MCIFTCESFDELFPDAQPVLCVVQVRRPEGCAGCERSRGVLNPFHEGWVKGTDNPLSSPDCPLQSPDF